jgi:cytochrome c oxidase subunit IV
MTLAEYRKRRGGAPEESEAHAGEAAHEEKHPGPMEYAQIGGILAVLTAIEVGLYYIELSQTLLVATLLVFSAAKFTLVVLWFMHLKFDHPLFSTMFIMGFFLAVSIFAVALATVDGKLV